MPPFRAAVSRAAVVIVVMLGAAGCGYVGEPLPPALHIPKPIAQFSARQVGSRIVVEFLAPELTTEDLPLTIGEVDLRAAPAAATWPPVDASSRVPLPAAAAAPATTPPGPRTVDVPVRPEWTNQRMRLSVRVSSSKGKWSEWAAPAMVDVVEPLTPPAGAKAESAPVGARLVWQPGAAAAGVDVRLFKRPYPNANWAEVARVPATAGEWLDPDSRFDVEQQYLLETVRVVESGEAASDRTSEIRITPVDTFPPAVPTGLTAIAGIGAVELAWDRPSAPDLAGFRIYRATASAPDSWQRLGDLVAAASFSDRTAQTGAAYRYAVSAVDRKGNESERSEPASITAP